ncbi:MAG: Fur family zinc uptake transcriptional regulator [Oleispira sp.]|jgi:Fur family zinc uptake transcriptional regulator
MSAAAYHPHDHQGCINTALQQAAILCAEQGVRLTPVRKRVLELVWQNHKPMGAYDLLPALAADGFNSAPPTVYRALDFLLDLGLVHRLASLNAFIGCSHPGHEHQSCFLICKDCGKAHEMNVEPWFSALSDAAKAQDFEVEHQLTEVVGTCPQCSSGSDKQRAGKGNRHES